MRPTDPLAPWIRALESEMGEMELEELEALSEMAKVKRAIGSRAMKRAGRTGGAPANSFQSRKNMARTNRAAANKKYRRKLPWFPIGEVKPDSKSGRSRGRSQLGLGWRANKKGNKGLVTYDRFGNVFATVWGNDGLPVWNGAVGVLKPGEIPKVPYGTPAFGNAIEDPVRRLMQRETNRRYTKKHPSARGADLVPVP